MSTVKKLFNSVFVVVVFLFTGARFAVTRVLPTSQSSQEPTSTRLFALTDAVWSELRASAVAVDQDKDDSKSANDKNEPSKSGEDKKEPSKSDKDSRDQSKSGCDKGGSKSADDNKDAPKDSNSDKSGPGGGDGDTGGGGG